MSEGTPAISSASPAIVFETLNAYQKSAALRAGIEINLFTAIGEGHNTVDTLATVCNASPRGVRILADFLTVCGLLTKQDGRYALTPDSALFLDANSPACMAATVRFLLHPQMLEPFHQLTSVVRSGHSTLPGEGTVEDNNPVWVEFARSMAPMIAPAVPHVAAHALNGLTGATRILDIAAGHGLFGIEVARRNAEAQITAVDWAAVLEVARENAAKAGVASRHSIIAGSAFDVDFARPYDVALVTNFLHHFDHETNVKLLRKVRAALNPGGRAVTLEFVPNDDRVSPPMPAAFAMIMLADTPAGDAFTYKELDAMHREAGFARTTLHPIPEMPQSIVVADV